MTAGFNIIVDHKRVDTPSFIAVEGPIGVGKTTLARHLATTFGYDFLEERADDNPFLERFYANPKAAALPTQLFFLFQRTQQLQDLKQQDMFQSRHVADFLIDKDRLFAEVTLDKDELNIYEQVYNQLAVDPPKPDLVIYLQAPNQILEERVKQRGVDAERSIDIHYLAKLNDAYMQFFHYYDQAPLLIVNAAELDLAHNAEHYQQLLNYLLTIKSGRHYYNPNPTI